MYNKAKFLRYIKTDMFLSHTWDNYKRTMPKNQLDTMLIAMFNSYVLENSVALREYETA